MSRYLGTSSIKHHTQSTLSRLSFTVSFSLLPFLNVSPELTVTSQYWVWITVRTRAVLGSVRWWAELMWCVPAGVWASTEPVADCTPVLAQPSLLTISSSRTDQDTPSPSPLPSPLPSPPPSPSSSPSRHFNIFKSIFLGKSSELNTPKILPSLASIPWIKFHLPRYCNLHEGLCSIFYVGNIAFQSR